GPPSGEMDPVAIWWPYSQGIPTGSKKGPRPPPETLRLPLVHLPGCGPNPRTPRLNTQFPWPSDLAKLNLKRRIGVRKWGVVPEGVCTNP
ncbi:MAG: hypothetical protein VXZ53_06455, partial [Planctomycetota bacterium]|nr:hypothetical protein [Planctomycetota bacterium]